MIVLRHEDEEAITATYGLTDEESVRDLLGVPPEAGEARAVKFGYLYTPEEAANDEFRLERRARGAARCEHGERVGTLAIFWRRAEHPVVDEELARVEELAAGVRPGPRERTALFGSKPTRRHRSAHRTFATAGTSASACAGNARGPAATAAVSGCCCSTPRTRSKTYWEPAERIQSVVRSTDVACHLGDGRSP